jgi:hypothetical protein
MFKRTFVTFIALLGLDGAAMAQADAPQPAAGKCATPAVADTAELDAVAGSNLMTVPVAINGTARRFLLEVNRTPDQVSEATMGDLHLPRTDQTTGLSGLGDMDTKGLQFRAAMYDVKSGVTPIDIQSRVRVTDFTIGGATVHGVIFVVANDRDLGKSKPYDGLLTTGLFSQYDINLDFGAKKLSFLTATSCPDPAQIIFWPHTVAVAVIPMTVTNGKISVPVTVQGHQIDAVIDTGSDRTVIRRDIAERTFGLKADTPEMTVADGMRDGAGQSLYQHTFPQIAFEGVVANNVPVLIQTNGMVHKIDRTPTLGSRATFASSPTDRIPDLTLGMDVLSQLHLYVAFGQNTLYVTAAK